MRPHVGIKKPAAPSSLTATAVSTTEIDLAWTDNSTNETGFKIERSPDGSTWVQIATAAANATSYNNTGLTDGTKYYYRVRAYNQGGNSAYSNTANDVTTMLAPTGLGATAIAYNEIDLTWTNHSTSYTHVEVQRSPDNSTWATIATLGQVTTYHDTSPAKNTQYYYQVRATNAVANSAYSASANATTPNQIFTSGPRQATTVTQTNAGGIPFWYDPIGGDPGTPDPSKGITADGQFAEAATTTTPSEFLQFGGFGSFSLPGGATIIGILVEALGGGGGTSNVPTAKFGQAGSYGSNFGPSANFPPGSNTWVALSTNSELGGLTWTDGSNLQFQMNAACASSGVIDIDACRATVYYTTP